MKRLKEKLNKNGGFTLVEMLIVVAIIAILVAVSIPIVNNALDRARHATDQANERSAKAEIMIRYLSEESLDITKTCCGWFAETCWKYDYSLWKMQKWRT